MHMQKSQRSRVNIIVTILFIICLTLNLFTDVFITETKLIDVNNPEYVSIRNEFLVYENLLENNNELDKFEEFLRSGNYNYVKTQDSISIENILISIVLLDNKVEISDSEFGEGLKDCYLLYNNPNIAEVTEFKDGEEHLYYGKAYIKNMNEFYCQMDVKPIEFQETVKNSKLSVTALITFLYLIILLAINAYREPE